MGQITFTPKQQLIIDEIGKSDFIKKNFYFTGGTALAAIYLHHRLSEDLDFFSEVKFDTLEILNVVTEWSKKHKFKIRSEENEAVRIFFLRFPDGEILKVDFGYYPYIRLETGQTINSIKVDGLLDIAVNKLQTIHQRSEVKDFVDLYFLLQKFTVWDLIEGVQIKFHLDLDPYTIAADYLKVKNFEDLPKMLVTLKLEDLKSFYIEKAQKLGMKAVKNNL